MSNISKELLDQVEKPSLLDGLFLEKSKDHTTQSRKRTTPPYAKPNGSTSITQIPKSQVLGKVKDFLQAYKDLETNKAKENPCSNFDIEVLNGDEKEYIEMDLLLGVADLYCDEAIAAAEASMIGGGLRAAVGSGSSSSSEDEDDGDDYVGENKCDGVSKDDSIVEESKPNKRPKIVMLD